jgi:hypothetical protein
LVLKKTAIALSENIKGLLIFFENSVVARLLTNEDTRALRPMISELTRNTSTTIFVRNNNDGDVAAFSHYYDVKQFDSDGLPPTGRKEFYLNFSIFTGRSDTGIFTVSEGNRREDIYALSSCIGKEKVIPGLATRLYELGTNLIPFYLVVSHELLHAVHFLTSLYYAVHPDETRPPGFLSYGKALAMDEFHHIITFCLERGEKAEHMSTALLRDRVQQRLGFIPGIDEHFEMLEHSRRLAQKRIGFTETQQRELMRLVRALPVPNMEELRTLFGLTKEDISEKSIRAKGGFPARYVYDAPTGVLFEKSDILRQIFTQDTLDYFAALDLPGFKCERDVGEEEAQLLPIEVRLTSFPDRMLKGTATALKCARKYYRMKAPTKELLSMTPSPDRTRALAAVSACQITPTRHKK